MRYSMVPVITALLAIHATANAAVITFATDPFQAHDMVGCILGGPQDTLAPPSPDAGVVAQAVAGLSG